MMAGSVVGQPSDLALTQDPEAAGPPDEVEKVAACNTMGQTEQVLPSFLR